MNRVARLASAALIALALGSGLACQNGVVGPSLTATVVSMTLSPTAKIPAGENVCCCHVVGTVKNTSSVGLHIRLTFPAKINGELVSTAAALERNVAPNEIRAFDAPGLYVPCSSLDPKQLAADKTIGVLGLWEPGQ